jgi:hypothetical protein
VGRREGGPHTESYTYLSSAGDWGMGRVNSRQTAQIVHGRRKLLKTQCTQVRSVQDHGTLFYHIQSEEFRTPIVMINGETSRDLEFSKLLSLHPHRGQRTRRCLGCATGGSGEVGIGEHSSWGGLTTYT